MYEYTFDAGETCAFPTIPIPINNDKVPEYDERFRIRILDISLPFGVAKSRDSATITIKDDDGKLPKYKFL